MAVSQTLTESALVNLQLRVEQMFTGDTPTQYQFRDPAATFGALCERTRANVVPRLIENGVCASVEVHHLIADSATIERVDGDWDLSCDLETPRYAESAKKTYDTDALAIETTAVNDGLCGVLFNDAPADLEGRNRAATLVAQQLEFAMRKLRGSLNTQAITFLNTARTNVNSDSSLPDYLSWNATPDFNYSADSELFQTPDFLTDIDAVAANTRIQNFFMLSGRRNFYNAVTNSDFRQLNDNERFLVRFNQYDMAFDISDLDAELTGANTFVVGEGTYVIWNASSSPTLPFQIDFDKWRFTIQDPVLQIYENGTLRPVLYEVVYQKTCANRDALTNHTFNHVFEVKFMGGIEQAPVASGANTGILKFVGITGV